MDGRTTTRIRTAGAAPRTGPWLVPAPCVAADAGPRYNVTVTSAAKKLLEQALALPEQDRRRIAERLLDSVPRETAEEIERAWNEEASRRADQVERGEVRALDGEQAIRELEQRLRSTRRS